MLLNLIGNGFYAASKRSRDNDGTYSPALKVMTRWTCRWIWKRLNRIDKLARD